MTAPSAASGTVRRTLATVTPDDVYLVSYPRSGSTWVRCVLATLLVGEPVSPATVERLLPDVHRADPGARPVVGAVVVKTHAPAFPLPARLVYLVRDGRDAMASYYHRQVALGRVGDGALPAFALDLDIWPCPWADHVDGWLDAIAARPADASLLVRYEDLVAEPEAQFARLAAWCGIRADGAAVAAAVEWNRPDALRALEAQAGAGTLNHVGTGTTEGLDPATAATLEQRWRSTLQRVGYTTGAAG